MKTLGFSSDDEKEEKYKVLVIDDEEDILELTKHHLEKSHEILDVETASSSEKALELIKGNPYDAVVADYKMPVMDGLDLLKKIRDDGIGTLYYLFTGKGGEETSQEALKLGAQGYFMKTSSPKERINRIGDVLVKSIENRREKEKNLIAWIVAWKSEATNELKKALKELAEIIGFEISNIEVQEISSEKEGIKAYTVDYQEVPMEKKDLVKKWRKIVSSEESVVRADVKMDKRIKRLENSKN